MKQKTQTTTVWAGEETKARDWLVCFWRKKEVSIKTSLLVAGSVWPITIAIYILHLPWRTSAAIYVNTVWLSVISLTFMVCLWDRFCSFDAQYTSWSSDRPPLVPHCYLHYISNQLHSFSLSLFHSLISISTPSCLSVELASFCWPHRLLTYRSIFKLRHFDELYEPQTRKIQCTYADLVPDTQRHRWQEVLKNREGVGGAT